MTSVPSLGDSRIQAAFEPGGSNVILPRGSLELSSPCKLLVCRSMYGAFLPDGRLASDTRWPVPIAGVGGVPPVVGQPQVEETVGECRADTVWGGNIVEHFGHFVTESTAHLWPLLPGGATEGQPVVLTGPTTPAFASEWLRAFGAQVVELPSQGAIRFTNIVVPEPAWRLENWITPEIRDIHLHARRRMTTPRTEQRDVVWLSRSQLGYDRSAIDERLFEWLLGRYLDIVHPQALPLGEQVAVLENARAATGIVGSAFHILLMTERTPDCLYLCPPWEKGVYPAQHWLLAGKAAFAPVLERLLATRSARTKFSIFPGGFRLMIPEAIRALSDTVLPQLRDDARIAAFADPENHGHRVESKIDAAVLRVLRAPLTADSRRKLAEAFENEGLGLYAAEQLAATAWMS